MSFDHNSARRNLILSAWWCSDARFCSGELDQKIIIGGFIIYGVWYMEIKICHNKVFRLHAVLNDSG